MKYQSKMIMKGPTDRQRYCMKSALFWRVWNSLANFRRRAANGPADQALPKITCPTWEMVAKLRHRRHQPVCLGLHKIIIRDRWMGTHGCLCCVFHLLINATHLKPMRWSLNDCIWYLVSMSNVPSDRYLSDWGSNWGEKIPAYFFLGPRESNCVDLHGGNNIQRKL